MSVVMDDRVGWRKRAMWSIEVDLVVEAVVVVVVVALDIFSVPKLTRLIYPLL